MEKDLAAAPRQHGGEELPEPVAWLQVGVFDGPYEGETLTRAKLPLKYDQSWWRFDGLYSSDQLRAYGDARSAKAKAEVAALRKALKPFADADLTSPVVSDTFGFDVLRARAALQEQKS